MQLKAGRLALRVALIYIIAAGAWILFSDELLNRLVHNPELRIRISEIKGWGFVLVTGGLLYQLLGHWLKRWEQEALRRQQEEAARQRSEQNYREIFNAANDAIFLHDAATGRILDVNEAMLRMYGYDSKTEILAGKMVQLTPAEPPFTWAEAQRRMAKAIQEGPQVFEWLASKQNGERFWVEVSLRSSQLDGQGRILAVVRDITARKRAEDEALTVARLSQQLSVATDPHGAADAVTETALQLLNWDACFLLLYDAASDTVRELINKDTIHDQRMTVPIAKGVLHPTPTLRRVIEQGGLLMLRRDATDDKEDTRRFGDMSRPSISLMYVALRHLGQVTGFLSVQSYRRNAYTSQDLATLQSLADQCAGAIARINAEEAMRASESRLQFLLTASPVVIYSLRATRDFAATFVSHNISQVLGYEPAAFTSDPDFWRAHIHPDDLPAVMADFAGLASAGAFTREYRLRHGDGSYRWIHDEMRVVRDAQKQPQELVGYWFDITARKQAEAELAHERNLQRTLIDHIPDSIYVQDLAGRFLLANETLARRFGVASPADLLGKSDADFYPAEVAADFAAIDREVFAGRTLLNYEQSLRLPNGERRVILSTKVPLKSAQGAVTAIVGIGHDITERKQAEAELRLSHDQHRRAIIAANAIPYQKDYAADKYVFMGEGIQAITGYTPAELRSSVWREIIQETIFLGEAAGLTGPEAIRRILAGELKSWQTDHRIRTRSGESRWISDSSVPILDAGGKYAGSIGIIQDITERKRAEARMNLQSSALTVAANAIAITDRQGRIEWVNPSFTRLTGYSAAECVGRNPRLLKSGLQSAAFYADLWATITAGNVWHGELINQRKDGRLYTEDMTITPVRAANGQITHFVAIKQDVTERRLLENQLRQAQKMEAIGTLAGGIAHDFNNILAAIFGYSYLLQAETENNPGAQDAIGEILKAANRAKDLVQQILTFSRQREQKREIIRLEAVVKEATKFLRASLPAEIQIEIRLAADAPAVLADPTQIYQVTMNLATNALHAMENRPGSLTVSLEAVVPEAALISAHPELLPMEYVRLSVADTGQGMDAPTLARIFDPFFTTKPVGKGTGLGLAVVHGIVQSHEGVITVESQPGQGTTFRLYFPAQTSGPELTGPAEKSIPPGHGQKILLVDDESALTAVYQRLLVRLEYQVTVCNRARESLALFRQNPAAFDLVLTDLTMPEMNGLEIARQIHALRPALPIVLVTGHAPNLTPENLRAAGICEVIEKPVSLTALAGVVQCALAKA